MDYLGNAMQTKTDNELVIGYAEGGHEAAFAELIARYQAMIFRTCFRMLGNVQDAEDARQAVFIVLARKAGSLRREGDLGGWLHRVARNVALQALDRREAQRKRQEELAMTQETVGEAEQAPDTAAVLRQVDAALDGLSAILRQAVILRYLRGFSEQEAAAQAGCPVGTMKWRTSDGIAKLRQRLAKRGVALSGVALAGLLTSEASAAVPETLLPSILAAVKGAAATTAAGTAATTTAAMLAKGAMKAMFIAKVKMVAAVVAAVVVTGTVVPVGIAVAQAVGKAGSEEKAQEATINEPTYELDILFITQQDPRAKLPLPRGGSPVAMAVDPKDDAEFVSLLIDARQSTIIPLKLVLAGNKEAETNNYDKSAMPSTAMGQPEVKKEKEPTVGQRVKASIKYASETNATIILDAESVNPPMIEDRTGQKFFRARRVNTKVDLPMKQWVWCAGMESESSGGNATNAVNDYVYLCLRKANIEKKAEETIVVRPETAQRTPVTNGDTNSVAINGNRCTYDATALYATYEGDVQVTATQFTLTADRVLTFFKNTNQLRRIEAFGHVVFRQPDRQVTCDKAVYEKAEAKVTLTGKAVLTRTTAATRGEASITASELVFNLNGGGVTASGGATVQVQP